ncbi:MAG: carbohydrate-binding domain-containing protein [Clostridia bacterium]|nr:carbohydrate-binding domain-containing protein [Clostridia bacterium]
MKLLKKSLAVFLCVLMVAAIAPFSAFAADEAVTGIVLYNESSPAVGGSVFTPVSYSVNGSTDKKGYVESIEAYWFSADSYSEDKADYSPYDKPTFEEGKAYCLYINLFTEVGYPMEDAWFTLKTSAGYVDGHVESYPDEENAKVVFFFDVIEMKEIYYLSSGVDLPYCGATISGGFLNASEDEGYTCEVLSWREEGTDAVPTVFEENKEYFVKIKYTVHPGYYLADEPSVTINSQGDIEDYEINESRTEVIAEQGYYIYDTSKTYSVTVENGKALYIDSTVTTATPRSVIWLEADPAPAGKVFDHWEYTGIRKFDHLQFIMNVPFTMPSCDVTVKAVYRDSEIIVSGVKMQDGDYLANGATAVQSTKPDGGYAYLKDNVLTLDNFDNEGKFNERLLYTPSAYVVFSDEKIDIVLKGENKITMNNVDERYDFAIYLSRECEITGDSFASLTVTGVDEGISAYELEFNGGNYNIDAVDDAIYSTEFIAKNANFNLKAKEYASIYSDSTIELTECVISIDAVEDGIVAYNDITIKNCVADIKTSSGDCIYSDSGLTIEGGTYKIVSNEDGLAAYDNIVIFDCAMTVVSADTGDDFLNFAIVSADGDVIIDPALKVLSSDKSDGSNAIDGFYFGADYVKIGEPVYEYTVTVENATASATKAGAGEKITVTANAAPEGKEFDKWKISGATLNSGEVSTYFYMPAANVTVKAIYKDKPVTPPVPATYTITVTNGTASKVEAEAGETVTLTANAAPEGKEFDKWVVTGATVTDESKATTTFKMPAANVTANATYKDKVVTPPPTTLYASLEIKTPSKTKINYKDGIVLYATAENLPADAKIEWIADNGNFVTSDDGNGNLKAISNAKGDTIFTAKIKLADGTYAKDASGNEIKDEVTLNSNAGLFQKIIGFFKGLFGLTKIYDED